MSYLKIWNFYNQIGLCPFQIHHNSFDLNLNILNCRNNQISFLSLGNNLLIDTLYVHKNNLTELEISSNTGLVQVWCFENQITQIDLH